MESSREYKLNMTMRKIDNEDIRHKRNKAAEWELNFNFLYINFFDAISIPLHSETISNENFILKILLKQIFHMFPTTTWRISTKNFSLINVFPHISHGNSPFLHFISFIFILLGRMLALSLVLISHYFYFIPFLDSFYSFFYVDVYILFLLFFCLLLYCYCLILMLMVELEMGENNEQSTAKWDG